jgi:spore coat protein U-like protein
MRNTCPLSDTLEVEVKSLPTLSINPIGPICLDQQTPTPLEATSSGGTFSGFGVSASSFTALNFPSGNDTTVTINYDYTDSFGCAASTSTTIDLIADPNPIIDVENPIL